MALIMIPRAVTTSYKSRCKTISFTIQETFMDFLFCTMMNKTWFLQHWVYSLVDLSQNFLNSDPQGKYKVLITVVTFERWNYRCFWFYASLFFKCSIISICYFNYLKNKTGEKSTHTFCNCAPKQFLNWSEKLDLLF